MPTGDFHPTGNFFPSVKPEFVQLDRIEAKLDRLISGPEGPIVGTKEAMRLTGAHSLSALYRQLTKLGIKPYLRGKYRRVDITNAIGRRALTRE